jgi:hypothetical protein
MDDLGRMIRDIPVRRALAEREPEPVRTMLIEFIDRQEREAMALQKARGAEN